MESMENINTPEIGLNARWERRIRDAGADFACFVDISGLPAEMNLGFPCALLFGKALSRDYVRAMQEDRPPKTKEVFNTERKMDALAVKLAEALEAEGYPSLGKLKTGVLPHKTAALRAGLGFIGKNNLLVTPQYGCAQMLGKVLTAAPFQTAAMAPPRPRCGECRLCAEACPSGALFGTTWSIGTSREEILDRKRCTLCLKCMVLCPHTARYAQSET